MLENAALDASEVERFAVNLRAQGHSEKIVTAANGMNYDPAVQSDWYASRVFA